MSLHRIIGLVLQCILLYNVTVSKLEPVREDPKTDILNLPHNEDPSFNDDINCHNLREWWKGSDDGTIPPGVCGLCPAGEHDLEPCDCISNGGQQSGLISIECGPSTHWTTVDEIKEMINSAKDHFITTHVFRFTLTGTNVSGSLKQDVWGPLDFHHMILDDNKIRYVDNHAFVNSNETLTLLSLKNNEITDFYWDLLVDVPHLYQLVLQGNNLTYIPSETFPQTEIAYLDLSRNKINYIGEYAFNNMRKLIKMNISHNQLEHLDDFMFSITQHDPDYNTLRIILSHNNISYISQYAFADVHPIHIDLSHNRLTTVDWNVFWPLITGNSYYLEVVLNDNVIVCDCRIFWMLDKFIKPIFGNFQCYDDSGKPTNTAFIDLLPSDFAYCTDISAN